jgi:dihydrofolate synthase/folylpolyglutamate synthase
MAPEPWGLTGPGSGAALADWLDWLERQASESRIEFGLDRVRCVAESMGLPMQEGQVRLPMVTVVVAGTNGKGSTCALLASIAAQAGYTVAVYASPHLLRFEERLTLNGALSAPGDWTTAFASVGEACAKAACRLTYFEWVTLAAFQMTLSKRVDLLVAEIGMGGRLDAVNLLESDAAVLTSVDLDHQAFLGETREQIGWEKAHVARAGRPFIVADPVPPETVSQVSHQIGADLWQFGRDFNYQGDRQQWSWSGRLTRRNALAYPALRGTNQLLNASAALAVFAALSQTLPVSQGAVRQGLALVELAGRFQVLPGQPAVVLDVAHNPHAAGVLAANLDQMGFFPQTLAVVGMLADKDAQAVFERLVSRVDVWCLAGLAPSLAGVRAQSAEALEQHLNAVLASRRADERKGLAPVVVQRFSDPQSALAGAAGLAKPSDRIVVFGSFITVAQAWHQAKTIGQAPHAPDAH